MATDIYGTANWPDGMPSLDDEQKEALQILLSEWKIAYLFKPQDIRLDIAAYGNTKDNTIYGFCKERNSDRHYCFNRRYEITNFKFSPIILDYMGEAAVTILDEVVGHIVGDKHGDYNNQVKGWDTYYLFSDESAPKFEPEYFDRMISQRCHKF
jgi:hypothetical protein